MLPSSNKVRLLVVKGIRKGRKVKQVTGYLTSEEQVYSNTSKVYWIEPTFFAKRQAG